MERASFDDWVHAAYAAAGCAERWERHVEAAAPRPSAVRDSAAAVEPVRESGALERHLRNASRLHRRLIELERQNAELRRALEVAGQRVFSCEEGGRVEALGAAARALAEQGEDPGQAPDANGPGLVARIAALMRSAEDDAPPRDAPRLLRIARGRSLRSLEVLLVPLRSRGRRRALAFVHDPERPALVGSGVLRELYDLTPREAAVAQLVCEGRCPDAIAAELGVKRETVKSHLKSLYVKTGAHRQAELVARLLGGLSRLEVDVERREPRRDEPSSAPAPILMTGTLEAALAPMAASPRHHGDGPERS